VSRATSRTRRGAAAVLGAVLVAGCSAGPASPSPVTDARPAPPAALERVADDPILHGSAVGAPGLVTLPDGTFLMHLADDVPNGGVLLRSGDGRAWAHADEAARGLDAGAILEMAANDTAVVILGAAEPMTGTGSGSPTAMAWTSADGTTWKRVAAGGVLGTAGARTIVGSPRGFASVGDARLTVLLSGPDGRQWRATELPVAAGARASVELVAPVWNGFIATGTVEGRSVMWRWDGSTWVRLPFDQEASISHVISVAGRVIATGMVETPDPANPDQATVATLAWESTDGGSTWHDTGLPLDGVNTISVFAVEAGFLAVLAPADWRKPLTAWRSTGPGIWEGVTITDAGDDQDRPLAAALAVSGRRVVLAGNTVGTGAGGDRVVVWTGDSTAP